MTTGKPLLAILTLCIVTSCGLATSDADRIAAAKQNMQAAEYRAAEIQLKSVLNNDPGSAEARLMLSTVHLGLNDLLGAEKELQRAADLGAPAGDVRVLQLEILARQGRYEHLLGSLDADRSGLSEVELLKFRGEALLGTRNGSAAEEVFQDWLSLQPNSADATVGYAKARTLQGDIDGAREKLELVIADDPQHTDAQLALAILHYGQGDYLAAKAAYQRALESSQPQRNLQRYVFALIALADTELMLRDTTAASQTIATLARYTPSAPHTLLQQARLAQMEKDDRAAALALQELITISPDSPQALMLLGSVQWRLGYFQQAEVYLSRAVALAPDNLQARKMWALIQLRRSNTAEAVQILGPLLDQQTEDAELNGLLAIADMQRGQTESALDTLLQTSQQFPENTGIVLQLAEGYRYTGDPQKAIDLLSELGPRSDEKYTREQILISALADLGQTQRASSIANEILESDTTNNEVLNFIGEFYISAGRADRGRAVLQRSRDIAPNDVNTLLALAALEERENHPDQAKILYESVIEIDVQNLPATLGLAQLAAAQGDHALAADYRDRAKEQHPSEVQLRLSMAIGHLNEGRNRQARALAREIARIGSDNPYISQSVGRILLDTGAIEEAQAQFEIANRQAPESVDILLGLSRSLLALGNAERAYEYLQQVLTLDPESAIGNSIMVHAELRLGLHDNATARMHRLRQQEPDDVSAIVVEGEVHAELGNYEEAVAAFQSAADMGAGEHAVIREFQTRVEWGADENPTKPLEDWISEHPSDVRPRIQLAQYYAQTGASNEARRIYEGLLDVAPNNVVILNNLAWEYQQNNDTERALTLALRARDLQPESGAIADTVGWIYQRLGKYDTSVKYLREAARRTPQNAEIRYHLAAALAEAGNDGEAAKILQEIIGSGQEFASRSDAQVLLTEL